MGSVLECLPHGSRVAIVRIRSLGDCVLTTPALDILRRSRPDLRVSIVVEDRFRDLFEDNPDIDDILAPSIAGLRQWRPRLCLNLHGGTRSAWMCELSGAEHRAAVASKRNHVETAGLARGAFEVPLRPARPHIEQVHDRPFPIPGGQARPVRRERDPIRPRVRV